MKVVLLKKIKGRECGVVKGYNIAIAFTQIHVEWKICSLIIIGTHTTKTLTSIFFFHFHQIGVAALRNAVQTSHDRQRAGPKDI